MTGFTNLGDNYEINENSNGNLEIVDSTGNAVLTHTDTAGWTFGNVSVDGITSLEIEQASVTQVAGQIYASTNTGTTVPNSTFTIISFDSVKFDATNVVSADTGNNKLTIQSAGTYLIIGRVVVDSNSGWTTGDNVNLQIQVNGSTVNNPQDKKVDTSSEGFESTRSLELAAGDDIKLGVLHNSGSDRVVLGSEKFTRLAVLRLG